MEDIIFKQSGGILQVLLNRPARKNAMTADMYTRFAWALEKATTDEAVRVVFWHGAGDSFCAGNDIGEFLKSPSGAGESPQASLMHAFIGFDKPIVAAVQGAAVGGGTTMLTHCDFVYAGESAKFQTPFINLGLVAEFGSSFSIPERVGHLRAAEMFLLGEAFNAARAAELGLVTRIVPDQDLLATATATVERLAAMAPGALRANKRLLKRASIEQLELAIEAENREFMGRLRSAEVKEALSAFLEKRRPNFTYVPPQVAAE
jgi:enoyl-CoA hydratase/carnithine racemase